MKRRHLIEFEDQAWFPTFLRNYMTDFLQHVVHLFDFYKGALPVLEKGLEKAGNDTIIDLCAGGGGPWLRLTQHLDARFPKMKVVLTDYYPNVPAFEAMVAQKPETLSFKQESVNALDVPENLVGLRTQFLSVHHFQPEEVTAILQNAVDAGAPIAFFEGQKRDVAHVIKFMLSPINVWVLTPFIRPFRWKRLLFTYLIPLVPLFVWWDGVVSVLRTYTVEEWEAMTRAVDGGDRYHWEISELKSGQVTVPTLLGYPKD